LIRVTTSSGSIYEIDTKESLIRRINQRHPRKGDEYWTAFYGLAKHAEIGQPLIIFMEPLQANWAETNVRMTTDVVKVEEADI